MTHSIPTLSAVQSLDGRDFATLTEDEARVLEFNCRQGRKFDVAVMILSEADPAELVAARSQEQGDEIMRLAKNRISVTIGPAAESAWADRA
ncbi:hypothetical protein HMPREF2772_00400 [Achromobacter xylosoxidans]|uniref:hypothetical protein n=1 Tax=Alcaligenes xylosoxydans xylosoxydans TaxID=85698 RepID=UPI0008A29375|nr:hypothetical protein [Achromobacter xylosoxidans]OFL45874.1 hypothetical protein HMPREF2772_00400 [Achromobacter xylosoxidans]